MIDLVEIKMIGYRAYLNGDELEDCPYIHPNEIRAWTKGWNLAAFDCFIIGD